MADQHGFTGRYEVNAVAALKGGSGCVAVQLEPARQPASVEDVAEREEGE